MSARTGLGALEVAVLAAVAEVGGGPRAGHRLTTHVLDVLECEHGFGARYAYPLLQDLAAPWRLHLPLLDPSGNWGTQHGDPAADARYTEVRLSEVGALALAAERGEVGPIPLGLVEGSLYRDGAVPPFAPDRVLQAFTTGAADRLVWPVTIEVDCRLPAPMRRRLAAWDRGDSSGLAALGGLL